MKRRRVLLAAAALSAVFAGSLGAQQTDSAAVATGRLIGRIVNAIDSTPVRQADLRLFFVDTGQVAATFAAHPTSALLAKVEIKEMSVSGERAKSKLDRNHL